MFDGTVPVKLEKLKEIYRAIDRLSIKIGGLDDAARREGLPAAIQSQIKDLEFETEDIKDLFEGVLTLDEQEQSRTPAPRPKHPWAYEE